MSAISLKSITGITSITTPAGIDNQLTLHTNNTTERLKIDVAGNVHVNNQLSIAGVSTFSEDVKFVGATSGRDVQWDKSANYLRFNDNAFATFGNSDDLFIYHDGNHSQIRDVGTGHLILGGTHLYLTDGSGSEYFLQCIANNQVDLYFNNSIKLSTTSTGITATGTEHKFTSSGVGDCTVILEADTDNNNEGDNPKLVFRQDGGNDWGAISLSSINSLDIACSVQGLTDSIKFKTGTTHGYTNAVDRLIIDKDGNIKIPNDNAKLQLGVSQDLELFHTGTHSYIQNSVGNLLIGSNYDGDVGGDIYIQAKYGENSITCFDDGGVELFYDAVKRFETTTTGAQVTTTSSAKSVKNITTSTSTPSGGSDGDLWFTYVA